MSRSIFADNWINLSLLEDTVNRSANTIFLTDRLDKSQLFKEQDFYVGEGEEHLELAIYPLDKLKQSLGNYFLSRDEPACFINYTVSDSYLKGHFCLNIFTGIDLHYNNNNNYYYHYYKGLHLKANIYNKLFFWGKWWGGQFNGDFDYVRESSPLLTGFYKDDDYHSKIFVNRLAAQIRYDFGFGNISLGRDKFNVGNNIGGSIILNDECNEYGYFSSEIVFGRLKMSFLHGMLIPDKMDTSYPYRVYDEKHIALHQVDLEISENLRVFFGENIVYGHRGVDLSYLLPHTFYRITEHNLRDRDNVKIYCGLEWHLRRSSIIYWNFILDELRKREFFGDWWGNKYAFQIGYSHFLNLLNKSDQNYDRVTFELSAVRPWTYTHKTPTTIYSHDGTGLGFPKGSNLIQFASELNLKVTNYLYFNTFWSFTRQGSLGDSYVINYDDRPKDTAKWLEGKKTNYIDGIIAFELKFLTHHSFRLGLNYTSTNSIDNQELIFSYKTFY